MPVKKTATKTVKKPVVKKIVKNVVAKKAVKKVSKPAVKKSPVAKKAVKKTPAKKTVVAKILTSKKYTNPIEAWKAFWKRGFTEWAGTSSRSEYWYSILLNWLFCVVLFFVGIFLFGPVGLVLAHLYSAVSFIPGISLMNRRLHDIGLSSWWWFAMLFIFIPGLNVVLSIVLIIVLCQPTSVKNNSYHKLNK